MNFKRWALFTISAVRRSVNSVNASCPNCLIYHQIIVKLEFLVACYIYYKMGKL